MRDFAIVMADLAVLLLLPALAAVLVWRRRRLSRALFALGAVLLALASLPQTGRSAAALLMGTVAAWTPGDAPRPVAVLVPTAGIYDDGGGTWRAGAETLRRIALARALQRRLGLPLIISGGAPVAGQPPEATVAARQLALEGVILETTARDTGETGQAVARLVADFPGRRILLVTSGVHVARMAAALRHAGLEVVAVVLPRGKARPWYAHYVPSMGGLASTQSALYEYAAIMWYMAGDRLDFRDLIGPW